jgi:hypothetical protein
MDLMRKATHLLGAICLLNVQAIKVLMGAFELTHARNQKTYHLVLQARVRMAKIAQLTM